ncbi:RpiB/LacA/LacB family sugar-phosphate isomerase [bacterium]|nr:RpiB/LacA/LacB family sugar-phosphate isomerase [bacterium]
MDIYFGADHAGYNLKNALIPVVKELGYHAIDIGAFSYDPLDDYPDFVASVAHAVSVDPKKAIGIVIGGSGQGEAIVANRFPNVRAVVFNGQYRPSDGREVPHEITLSREHNDANVLALGSRFLSEIEAKEALTLWLGTPFSGDERHARRIAKIEAVIKKFDPVCEPKG